MESINQSEIEKIITKSKDLEIVLESTKSLEYDGSSQPGVHVTSSSEPEKSQLNPEHLEDSDAEYLLAKVPKVERPHTGESTEIEISEPEKLKIAEYQEKNNYGENSENLTNKHALEIISCPKDHDLKVLATAHAVEPNGENHKQDINDSKVPNHMSSEPLRDEPILDIVVIHDIISEEAVEDTKLIEFTINYSTSFGESILVVGSSDKLGSWNSERGLKLEWNEGNIWKCSIRLPEKHTEYKYVCVWDEGQRWEEGDNRKIHFDEVLHYDIWQKDL